MHLDYFSQKKLLCEINGFIRFFFYLEVAVVKTQITKGKHKLQKGVVVKVVYNKNNQWDLN